MATQINAGFIVIGNPDYVVVESGLYDHLDFVPCCRRADTNGPNCSFLAATVLGLNDENSG